jgi:hypothetical protein
MLMSIKNIKNTFLMSYCYVLRLMEKRRESSAGVYSELKEMVGS